MVVVGGSQLSGQINGFDVYRKGIAGDNRSVCPRGKCGNANPSD